MSAGSSVAKGPEWLLGEWASRFAAGYEAMASEPLPRKTTSAPAAAGADALVWRQPFDLADGAAVEITIPAAGWRAIGTRVLAAAGIEDAGDEDARPTYLEVLQQSLSGLASALSAALDREVACGKGGHSGSLPPTGGVEFQVQGQSFICGFASSSALLDALRPSAPVPAPSPLAAAGPATSASMELLYDVELPVSVSFGRAHMPVKEVLKLTSGSIVELNRGISEPVEIIINNCVIARGEVVVIEGNYGVRILEIVSRAERLRTLH
jgi:flagellar motor switch protein FliN